LDCKKHVMATINLLYANFHQMIWNIRKPQKTYESILIIDNISLFLHTNFEKNLLSWILIKKHHKYGQGGCFYSNITFHCSTRSQYTWTGRGWYSQSPLSAPSPHQVYGHGRGWYSHITSLCSICPPIIWTW
jgi:hypothetical protein